MRKGKRILIAEDEPDMLHGLEGVLRKEGYEVHGAVNGLEAAEKLEAESFDVVVSDLRMPIIDGVGLLRTAKRTDKSILFIIITAYGTESGAVETMRLGCFDYMAKPFPPSALVAAIERGPDSGEPEPPHKAAGAPKAPAPARLHFDHTWALVQPDGTVLIGADERFFEEAGDIVFCDLPYEGAEVVKGERCARTIDTTSLIQKPFFCPLSGIVVKVNERMEHEPWEAQRDPYGEAWLFKIIPSKLEEEIGTMTPENVKQAPEDVSSGAVL